MSERDMVVQGLTAHPKGVLVNKLSAEIGVSEETIRNTIAQLMGENTPGLIRRGRNAYPRYAIRPAGWVAPMKLKPVYSFALPENLFRGWYNPLTGITGSKLGV